MTRLSLDCYVCSELTAKSMTLFCNQAESLSLLFRHTASALLTCKYPASPPLLCIWAESLLLHARFPLLAFSYVNQPLKKYMIYLHQGWLYIRSKQLYYQIKQIYDRFKNLFPSSLFGSDKLVDFPYNKS